ncbi:NYN domain-containing protein [Candidatus Gottesmanbacteria bacterium]|nr:NYN domain-containing protein [Candidatus Gottesmanbacteria bacterium]
MKQERCIILVDGSNFYFKLKDLNLHRLINFDFSSFSKTLAGDRQLTYATYYIGAVRSDNTKKTQKLFNQQRKLLNHLRKHNFKYSLGYLLKSNGRFREKGVDVNIAVDILVSVYENLCDYIILVSSDTDLLPAIKKAKEKGKTVEYIGFSHRPSIAMVANCSKSRLWTKEDLLPFIRKANKQKK